MSNEPVDLLNGGGAAPLDDADRLAELIASRAPFPVADYVALIRRLGRSNPERVVQVERLAYSYGLQQAFLEGDAAALANIARLGAAVSDAKGEHEEAIARVNQALTMIAGRPADAPMLLASRAFEEAVTGRVADAKDTARLLLALDSTGGSLDVRAPLASMRCVVMEMEVLGAVSSIVIEAQTGGKDYLASSLMVQVVSAYASVGRIDDSRQMAQDLLEYATEVGHRARQVDAEVALIALGARIAPTEAPSGLASEAERLMNNHAMWKLFVALFRQHVIRGQHEDANQIHTLLVKHYDWLNPGYRNAFSGLAAYQSALLFDGPVDLEPPHAPTLLSVDNVLASAEAVAIGGVMSAAGDWLAWLEAELPAEVVTSLEWPACRQRVVALLELRLGQREIGIERLEAGIRCCDERGDTIEAALGRAQLGAITEDAALRDLAAGQLQAVGIDPAPFEAAARRVVERAALAGPEAFTVAEVRVLGRLARGMSHREIEADLGLARRGASRSITAVYGKLGVTGRVHAARVAAERAVA